MRIQASDRLSGLGSAIFAEVTEWKKEALERGRDLIDLGIGSPDQPPSPRVMEALRKAVSNPLNFGYPTSEGTPAFRGAVARWYKQKFNVHLDPEHEVLALMGSQDGLAHLALAVTNPGDIVLVPDPGYPIYTASLVLAGVTPYRMPLRAEDEYLPKWDAIPASVVKQAKLMILNYPSNPLSAVADLEFFQRCVDFARANDILIVHDLAYSEMAFDGFKPPSLLQIAGAKEVAVEFHSLSKSFNMAGCRIAFMVGHPEAVQCLKALKSNIDYGIFLAVQEAGIVALEEDLETADSVAACYERRRDVFIDCMTTAGWPMVPPKATMFVWAKVPEGWSSRQISREILISTGVAVIPGDAFGAEGEGYVRIALVQNEDRLREAARRIGYFLREHHRKQTS
ncbi:aminotransferase [Paenibacillus swuensis]|uniref:Aminotransferase n=1 Tax=Paenibacillus swuensis TaxID=1178515 RepID=A0A172TNW1_9BACL|nr:aminotransferase class I/II-fold pyridoxal phosphate-dependent enzyme [Paenibacillus swuensis]ANE48594.1 aminotransferase [Paenibacillus swuensis]